ncbi:MAG: acetate uptake transporter [Bacillota bacterium]|nr:acetate uptake transporter [Bacillota bacterium]
MQTNETKITTADPSALGLFGLAMVTLVASSQKLGLTTGTSLIIPWSFFLGASAQLIAGILDSKRNNVFGTTVFTSYGLFWLGVTMTWMINLGVFGEGMANNIDIRQLGFAFIGYFIFSLIITIGSMKTNKVLFIDFILIDLLFLGLSLSTVWGIEAGHTLAAYSELLISIVTFYAFAATILNTLYEKVLLPVGKPFNVFKDSSATIVEKESKAA